MFVAIQMQLNNLKNCILSLDNITQNSFGNRLLYYMSNPNENSRSDTAILADKIWIIGRAYAVSPERKFTFKKGTEKVKYSHGDGTGEYFKHIAEYIILHFHFPRSFFIFDSFTFDSGKQLCSKYRKRNFHLENEDGEILNTIKGVIDKYKVSVNKATNNNELNKYITHCINSYMLCCFIKNDLNIDSQISYPRISDRILQHI